MQNLAIFFKFTESTKPFIQFFTILHLHITKANSCQCPLLYKTI